MGKSTYLQERKPLPSAWLQEAACEHDPSAALIMSGVCFNRTTARSGGRQAAARQFYEGYGQRVARPEKLLGVGLKQAGISYSATGAKP